MSLVSVEAQNASLAMSYGADAGSLAPTNIEFALFDASGDEITGGGYARPVYANDGTTWPDAPAGGQVSTQPSFAASSGAWSDTATRWGIFDADTGDAWDDGVLSSPITVAGAGVVARPIVTVFYVDPEDSGD